LVIVGVKTALRHGGPAVVVLRWKAARRQSSLAQEIHPWSLTKVLAWKTTAFVDRQGAATNNNLLCIGERKSSLSNRSSDELMDTMPRHGRLSN